jgi:dynein heavy chain
MSEKKETNILKPPGHDTRLIVYLEDLHMTWVDETKDQPAIESIRDFFMQKQWYSPNKKATRKIQSTNFVTCFDSVVEQKETLSLRTLAKFFVIGLNSYDLDTAKGIFTQLFEIASQEWPSAVSGTIPKLAKAIMQLYNACFEHLKPTPIKVHYTFNHRECFKMVTAICKIESSYLKNEVSMMRLFYHEAMRQYADKILMKHDLQWFMSTL